MSSRARFSLVTAFALICVVGAVALLSVNGASAGKAKTEECGMDAVSQSICVYRLILDDIDAKVTMRGGGGVTEISQAADDTFVARLAQEGHEDIRTYQIELPESGAPRIVSVKESTKSY